MSDYGEEILSEDRLNPNSNLSNPESDGYKLIDNTIGWLMDSFEDSDRVSQLFINSATGKYLDILCAERGIYRLDGETDDEFRERAINIQCFTFTKEGINKIGGVVYCNVSDLNTQCTSKNVVLSNQYIIDINDENKEFINQYVNNNTYKYISQADIGGT